MHSPRMYRVKQISISAFGYRRIALRISKVKIENFRCLENVELAVDDLTVLIGANGTGKSSVLRALRWFFDGGELDTWDVCGQMPDIQIVVGVTFRDLTPADREQLGSYATEETATFWRTWSAEEGEKLTGRALAYAPFEKVRGLGTATERKKAYSELRREEPTLEPPSANSGAAAEQAMRDWESSNPDELTLATTSATHLFGFRGQPRLAGRFDYVFVPAVSDAEEQTRHARGTLLQQVMSRSLTNQDQVEDRLKEIHSETTERVDGVLREEHGEKLDELSERFTSALREYVPTGSVTFEPQPPEMKMPPMQVGLRVADGEFETDVGRQGHGFQRALLMAAVQELSRAEDSGDPPALFLAIEEPELYQHPTQARHFARTLSELPRSGQGAIQIGYATHNEHFVDPSRYECLRRFQKKVGGATRYPTAEISMATTDGIAQELSNIMDIEQVPRRISITLQRTLSEAVFAHAVVLVEGRTDEALLRGVADREGGFDAMGVAIIDAQGKMQLSTSWAILKHLGIPTFLIFDGDKGVEARGRSQGKSEKNIASDIANVTRWNQNLLSLLELQEEDWPATRVRSQHAIFEDTLEDELKRAWPEMFSLSERIKDEGGEWRPKSEDCYRQAARDCEGEIPRSLADILTAVKSKL